MSRPDRRKTRLQVCGLALLALVAMLAAAASASGGGSGKDLLRGSRVLPEPYGRGGVSLQAGTADSDITIETNDARGEIVITDQAGITIRRGYPGYGRYCNQVSTTAVRCELFEPGGIRAGLGDGNDRIEIRSTHHAPVVVTGLRGDDTILVTNPADATSSRLQGNGGDDVIVAGPSDDNLTGGPGADTLRGAAGNDQLNGKPGADVFSGGAGDDELKADHHDRDRSIRCGPGSDEAEIDRALDPLPSACEHIS